MAATSTFCLLTKTYRGDIVPFERLCRSIDRHNPDVTHYVLIDACDHDLFARFATSRRILVDCDAALPQLRQFTFRGKRYWWLRGSPWIARGWIQQQVAKIEVTRKLSEDAVVIFDSDMMLVSPVCPEHVFSEGKVRLYQYPGRSPDARFAVWHDVAMKALGLKPEGYTGHDYVAQPTVWSPPIVQAMVNRIEHATGKRWLDALVRRFRFSEYILYGIFCDKVPGVHADRVAPTDVVLTHTCWDYDLTRPAEVDRFVSDLDLSRHGAVLIQSNLKLGDATVSRILDRIEQATTGHSR